VQYLKKARLIKMVDTTTPSVTKVYESYPAYELIKSYVVQQLIGIGVQTANMNSLLFLNRKDRVAESQYKASVLTFYQFLRPKMIDHSKHDKPTQENVASLDYFIVNPSKFDIRDAIMCYNILNQFCEDYRLTSTISWSGYGKKSNDIYNA
jgi:hypothetical protein